jgi:hypothetical protein
VFNFCEKITSFNFLCNTHFYWLKIWVDFVSPEKNLSVMYMLKCHRIVKRHRIYYIVIIVQKQIMEHIKFYYMIFMFLISLKDKELIHLFCLVMELSPEKKKKMETLHLCATRNDAVFRHFFFRAILHHQQKINKFIP